MRPHFTLAFLLLLFTAALPAQEDLTVEGIMRQSAFIEAKQLVLLGKPTEAIEQFVALAEADDRDDAVHFELARLYRATDRPDAAIEQLRKAYAARPNDIYAAYLADLYRETGRHEAGAELHAGMVKRDPDNEQHYLDQAAALTRARDVKAAIGVYNDLEDRIGVNEELARLKHALYLGDGDTKRAEKELLSLIEAFPKTVRYRHLLAGFYTAGGNAKAAEKTYRNILAIEPADVRAQLALQDTDAPAAAGSASDDELLALLGRSDVDIDLKIGKILPIIKEVALTRDAEKVARGLRLAQELRRVHPDEAKAAALVGDFYFQSGQLDEAADAYIETLELDDNVYTVWEQLLGTLYLSNRTVDLRKYAERALDIYPNRPAVYVHYALGEAFRANLGEAESLLSEAELMVSSQTDATQALTELRKAFASLKAGTGGSAPNLSVLPGGEAGPLSFLLTNKGAVEKLKAYDSPTNTNALFLEYLGDALAETGDEAAAAKAYQRAKAAGSKSRSLTAKLSRG